MSDIEPVHLQQAGATWWHSAEGYSPGLSKGSLGEFFFHVLKAGGHIGSVWPFAPQYPRSAVYVTVFMTEAMKAQVESETNFKFKTPPQVRLS